MKNKFYFVEDFDPRKEFGEGILISLTPESCFQLQQRGLSYKNLEDYYRETELMSFFSDSYLKEQLQWFEDFDHYLKLVIPDCRENEFRLIHHLRYRLKYFLDSIISQCFIFQSFFNQTQASTIVYLKKMKDEPGNASVMDLANNRRSFFHPLMTLLCREKGIVLENSFISAPSEKQQTTLFRKIPKLEQSDLKEMIKSVYFFLKYKKYRSLWGKDKKFENLKILFLTAGHKDCDPTIRELIGKGASVYLKSDGSIYDLSSWTQKKIADLSGEIINTHNLILESFKKAGELLNPSHPLILWINKVCRLDVSFLVLPYLKDFLQSECCSLASEVPSLIHFFDQSAFDYLVSRTANNLSDAAGLLAAEKSAGTARVCFQHGCLGADYPVWSLSQAPYFDVFFATDPETKEYSERTFPIFSKNRCQIREYSSFLNHRQTPFSILKRDFTKKIYYVPTRNFTGVRMLNSPHMPTTWYYHLQIAILDCLASMKDLNFVFKYVKMNDWLGQSTLAYLRWKKFSNIELDDTPFWKCLDQADRVIMDQSGTALYETSVCDIPILCLYYEETTKLRSESLKYFGKCLQPFNNAEEACLRIRDFLSSDPKDFIINLPLTKDNPVDTLARLRNVRKNNQSDVACAAGKEA